MTVHDVLRRNALLEDAHDETLPRDHSDLGAYVDELTATIVSSSRRNRSVDAALLFVDVSGYTALTERLSSLGRVGSETLTDIVNSCFERLIDDVIASDGHVLRFGGDALFIAFIGPDRLERAGRYSAGDAAHDPRPAGDPGTRRPGATVTVDRPSSRRPPAASLVGFVDRGGAVRPRRDRSVAMRGRSPCRSDRHQ